MKALTICQPYAELIVRGAKRVENRTWPTSYRGLMYIHAGKSRAWLDLSDDGQRDETYDIAVSDMPFGAVVAIARLVDCVPCDYMSTKPFTDEVLKRHPWISSHEHASGPWCWILAAVNAIGPWPYRGAQGLWELNDATLDRVANSVLGIEQPRA